ncbi:hypothetical protein MMA231_03441 (plasmid) [Asticcacaulis sp. MM231]|uniref:DUF1800 domain-containing protein n=1 Tax=Asticcacaulis sp. MM231 TaxID=3157666 RepID=UPI0032D56938
MVYEIEAEAAIALSRFGLGAHREGYKVLGKFPRKTLLAEIDRRDHPPAELAALPSGPRLLQELIQYDNQVKTRNAAPNKNNLPSLPPDPYHASFFSEIDARFNKVMLSDVIGFRERLVMFWSNHFAISYFKASETYTSVGAFEREAIRPYVFRKFSDMLTAVERHPCMLLYLDNTRSLGPNSKAGLAVSRGLNENLAREILELHTLGVGSGYTQADVTALSRVITGWSSNSEPEKGPVGAFIFHAVHHEPGTQTILGKSYPDKGMTQGMDVLNDLAIHPATARHISFKLARHFISDNPPIKVVARLEKAFNDTGGDLGALTRALILSPEAWTPKRAKIRMPQEYLSAIMRLTGHRIAPQQILDFLRIMGQPNWGADAPNGFSDLSSVWSSPAEMSARLSVANYISYQIADIPDPGLLVESAFGPILSDTTRQAITRAETRQQALTLLFMSPEFMRR